MISAGNSGSGDVPERDSWQTEQTFWDILDNQYDFLFDCCASKENTKCKEYSSDFEAEQEEKHRAWMNPPFSNAKNMFIHFFKIVDSGVAIYRCDNLETQLWQEIIFQHADWVFIPRGRINYAGMDGKGSRFPSALIGIGLPSPKGLDGTTLVIIK